MKKTTAFGILAAAVLSSRAWAVDPTITVSDQAAEGGAVTVESVVSPADGFVVIHAVKDGKPGAVVGHAPVKAFENQDVKVELGTAPTAGASYVIMLHEDTGAVGTYEFGGNPDLDKPVTMGGEPVTAMFKAM